MKHKRLISIFTLVCFLLTFIPIAAFAEETIPTSGTCGEQLTWKYADGVLTIRGTGEMDSYEPLSDRPWESVLSNAALGSVRVVVEEGVTSIGSSAFEGLYSIKSVELPDSLTTI